MSKIKYLAKAIFIGSILIATSQVFAANEVKSRTISYLRTYNTFAVISLSTNGPNDDNCTRNNAGKYVYIDLTSGKGKAMYASILTAHAIGRRITVALSGCADWGSNTNIPKAYRIDLYAS